MSDDGVRGDSDFMSDNEAEDFDEQRPDQGDLFTGPLTGAIRSYT